MTGSFLHPFAPTTGDHFISLNRGPGAVVWDIDGNEYLDAMTNLWYCAIGHGHQGRHADDVRARMLDRGVITRAIHDQSLKLCPPLITTDHRVDQIIDPLATSITE